jgi:hypothetical protein
VCNSEREDPTREEILALYGAAMRAAQDLEEAMAGLVGVRSELSVIARNDLAPSPEQIEALERIWEDLFAWPAGRLRNELKLGGQLGEDLERAVRARNLLAHHYLRDHGPDLEVGPKRAAMATRLRDAAEHFQSVTACLEVERMVVMHTAGLTDDHVTTPSEARRMRYYDPALDDAVPPEPFADD